MVRYIFIFIFILSFFQGNAQDLERRNIYFGNSAFGEEDYEKAIEYYQEAIDVSPLSYKANFNLGNALFRKGDFEKATEIFTTLIDLAPTAFDRSKVYHNLGNCQFMNQQLDEAISSYEEALKLNPS